MLDDIETVLLVVLPWAFVAKSIALGLMWWALSRRTVSTGPLGDKINWSFRDQFIMSLFITWMMFIVFLEVDATEIDWPVVTFALLFGTLWPFITARSHYRVLDEYRRIAQRKAEGK